MGNHPSSIFGFGVGCNDEICSEEEIWGENNAIKGIMLVYAVSSDYPQFFLFIEESFSTSDDWTPCKIDDSSLAKTDEWSERIMKAVQTLNLTDKLDEKFSQPGFVHSPYYGLF